MAVSSIVESLRERIPKSIVMNQIVGITLPDKYYDDIKQVLFEFINSKPENYCVYVTITRPYNTLANEFGDLVANTKNIKFVDCVSRIAGISNLDPNCEFIESPTMLEKLGLEIINQFKEADEKSTKFLILDSLSTLMVYNEPEIVTKFFYYLINITRAKDIHSVYLVIEEEEADKHIKKLINLTDKIEKIVDSFI
jgi:KaiC/GvpD/RAD55 family RecA-like ATPase